MLKGCVIGCKKRCITLRKSLMSHSRRIHLEVCRSSVLVNGFSAVVFGIRGLLSNGSSMALTCGQTFL